MNIWSSQICVLIFFSCIPRSGIVGSCGSSVFHFLRHLRTIFPQWLRQFTFPPTLCCVCLFARSLQSCPTLCNPMNCSTPGLPVHHQLLEFTQTRVHRVGDAIINHKKGNSVIYKNVVLCLVNNSERQTPYVIIYVESKKIK